MSRAFAASSPARARRASSCSSSRVRSLIAEISLKYVPRFARFVSRVSARTSVSSASTSASSGSSGIASWTSSLIVFVRLCSAEIHLHRARRQRQQVERVVHAALVANLEVHVLGGGAPRPADEPDHLPRLHVLPFLDEVALVVRVDGHEAAVVLDLHHLTIPQIGRAH